MTSDARGFFLGIDAGSSSTKWTVINDKGEQVSSGKAKPIDAHIYRNDSLIRFNEFLEQLKLEVPGAVVGIYAGVTGASEIELENLAVKELFQKHFPLSKVKVEIDVALGYRSAFGDDAGIYLYAGTGSIAVVRNKSREIEVLGGWGYLLGDEGAGYWIGRELLRHALLGIESREPDSTLIELLRERIGGRDRAAILKFTYENSREDIAKLAKPLIELASKGDETAKEIVRDAAKHLAELVFRAKKQSQLDSIKVVFGGGIAQAGEVVLSELEKFLNTKVQVASENLSHDAARFALLEM